MSPPYSIRRILPLLFWAATHILSVTKEIRKTVPETMIIEAPDVRLYRYENHRPVMVNTAPNKWPMAAITVAANRENPLADGKIHILEYGFSVIGKIKISNFDDRHGTYTCLF
jgi:hypothetical protein